MKNLLIPILGICIFYACKKDVDVLPVERPFTRDFYVQGAWRDTLPDVFEDFDYTVGKVVEAPFGNQYSCRSEQATTQDYKTIQSNVFGFSTSNPLFFVRFSSPVVNSTWSASELNDLFVAGRVFPITGKSGDVEIGFELPATHHTFWLSQSGNAPHPSGEVKIVSSEAYEWTYDNGWGDLITKKGLKVNLQFHATLGRLGPVNGHLKVVGDAELQTGEASLFFAY